MSDDLAVAADGVHGLEVVTLFGHFFSGADEVGLYPCISDFVEGADRIGIGL